jgi:hypothetical protein
MRVAFGEAIGQRSSCSDVQDAGKLLNTVPPGPIARFEPWGRFQPNFPRNLGLTSPPVSGMILPSVPGFELGKLRRHGDEW